MPSPVLITGLGDLFALQTLPYLIGSDLYVLVNANSGVSFTGQMWKSSDAGVTWLEMDAAGEQVANSGSYFASASDGTSIWAVYGTIAGFMAVVVYDPGTDTWGLPTVTTNVSQSEFTVLFRASDSSLVVLAQAFATPEPEGRPGVFLFDTLTNTFTAFVQTAGTTATDGTTWSIVGVAPGIGTTVYFFYVRQPDFGTAGTSELIVQPFTGSTPGALFQFFGLFL